MCMVAPNPCLFNKSCALKGVNLAKFIEDRLAFVFGESRPKFCHKAGLLLLRFVTKRSSTFLFFCFLGFFYRFFLRFFSFLVKFSHQFISIPSNQTSNDHTTKESTTSRF